MDYVKMAIDWDERALEPAWKDRILTGAGAAFWPVGQRHADALVDRFGLTQDSVAVDYGCGAGRVAIPLAQQCKVIGVDVSKEMLQRAFHHSMDVNGRSPEFQRIRHDGALWVQTASVDLVFEILVLQHVPYAHLPRCCEEIARVLKPGGHFCALQVMAIAELDERSKSVPASDTWHSRRYSLGAWEELLKPLGLQYRGDSQIGDRIQSVWQKV